jgi:hypothetical protein
MIVCFLLKIHLVLVLRVGCIFGLTMEISAFKTVFFYFSILLMYVLLIIISKGVFNNLSTSYSAIFMDSANTSALFDGVSVTNSTFHSLKSTNYTSPAIYFWISSGNINISDCFFTNISSSYISDENVFLYAGAVYYWMGTEGNGYYNIKGNTFYEISTNKGVLVLNGIFSNLTFTYNIFYNVSSITEGGVFIFFFLF